MGARARTLLLLVLPTLLWEPAQGQPSSADQCRTRWFDRDNPSGVGDFETLHDLLNEYPDQLCPNPIGIEAKTVDGVPASATGQTFGTYNVISGFSCVNSNTQVCLDYMVLFICPESFCSSCRTKWFDRDDPSGYGDYELLPNIINEYPSDVCRYPIGVEAQTLLGAPANSTGQSFTLYDALSGFACVNAEQPPGSDQCKDYRVRFTCPKSFCTGILEGQCRTRWFDRDDPSGRGDFETLSDLWNEYPDQLCRNPVGIEAKTVDGVPASATGQTFGVYNVIFGFSCVNSDTQACLDYMVLFICPDSFCSSCRTKWFDRDNPSGFGDYETLTDIVNEYPSNVCTNPIGVEAQTLQGAPAELTGQIFNLYDALSGFACVNAEQSSNQCMDYRVRFSCPKCYCMDINKD